MMDAFNSYLYKNFFMILCARARNPEDMILLDLSQNVDNLAAWSKESDSMNTMLAQVFTARGGYASWKSWMRAKMVCLKSIYLLRRLR